MTATIVAFPADRCRQPRTAIEAREQLAYRTALAQATADPANQVPVVAMVRLALEGVCASVRSDAAAWLMKNCNVKVTA